MPRGEADFWLRVREVITRGEDLYHPVSMRRTADAARAGFSAPVDNLMHYPQAGGVI
jgi:hypothetical protein